VSFYLTSEADVVLRVKPAGGAQLGGRTAVDRL
jgi:hypothetical protein